MTNGSDLVVAKFTENTVNEASFFVDTPLTLDTKDGFSIFPSGKKNHCVTVILSPDSNESKVGIVSSDHSKEVKLDTQKATWKVNPVHRNFMKEKLKNNDPIKDWDNELV